MQTTVKRSIAPSLLLILGLILTIPTTTGCGKSSSPTAPHVAAAEPESLLVTVTLTKFEAVVDGDGIEGAGDFEFSASATEVGGAGRLAFSRNASIDAGDSYTINNTLRVRVPKSRSFTIGVRATEWDADILGRDYPDSRMDNLSTSRTHAEGNGAADLSYSGYLQLGGSELQVRLHYTIASVAI